MLTINIDTQSTIPMYEQIYNYIKQEIKSGNLTLRTKLPSSRNLAVNLQVSRNTVDMAYSQLVSEGYIESIPKSGYYVCLISDLTHINFSHSPSVYPVQKAKTFYQYDFSPFAIDINSFPDNVWRKLSKNCLNDNNNNLFLLGDNQGDESLRTAIAGYLHESRGVNCNTEQIIIGAGADYLLQLLSQILMHVEISGSPNNILDSGKSIAIENPTYKQAYKIFTGMHYNAIPIDLDHNGINMKHLAESLADIVYVTPSHQYPLGIVMPIKRRLELLQWANTSPNRYIIEDDHDSEFRYKGKPIPALQGIDSSGKVIYIGTFSRAIAPAIRIGYMVLPQRLMEIYRQHLYYYSSTVSRVDQNIMTNFIKEGYFERHLNKMRKIYKNKHDLLIHNLKIFGDSIQIEGENAGLHLVLRFSTSLTEKELIDTAAKKSIKLYGLSEHYITSSNMQLDSTKSIPPTILLGYANISEQNLEHGILELYEALKDSLGVERPI
jgi:GntR family transcriptional regulator/MocR family aminotransferase